MDERLYPVGYRMIFSKDGFTKAHLKANEMGGCDAFVLVSIIRDNPERKPHEGSKNIAFLSMDGHSGNDIPDTEIFQVFSNLAKYLSESKNIPEWSKGIANVAFQSVRNHMKTRRNLEEFWSKLFGFGDRDG